MSSSNYGKVTTQEEGTSRPTPANSKKGCNVATHLPLVVVAVLGAMALAALWFLFDQRLQAMQKENMHLQAQIDQLKEQIRPLDILAEKVVAVDRNAPGSNSTSENSTLVRDPDEVGEPPDPIIQSNTTTTSCNCSSPNVTSRKEVPTSLPSIPIASELADTLSTTTTVNPISETPTQDPCHPPMRAVMRVEGCKSLHLDAGANIECTPIYHQGLHVPRVIIGVKVTKTKAISRVTCCNVTVSLIETEDPYH